MSTVPERSLHRLRDRPAPAEPDHDDAGHRADRAGRWTDPSRPSHRRGLSSRVGQAGTAFVILVSVAVAAWGAGAFGGAGVQDTMGGLLGEDGSWLAPAAPAFGIWSLIYAGLLAYAVWQFLPPAQTRRHDGLRGLVLTGVVLNSGWLVAAHLELLWLTVVVILALLAVLVTTLLRLERRRHASWSERILLDGVQGVYLGWICAAAVANVFAWLSFHSWLPGAFLPATWALAGLVIATIVGAVISVYDGGRIGPAAALAWGLAWIGVGRSDGTGMQSGSVAVTAIGCAGVVLLCWALALWLSHRSATGEARDVILDRD